MSTFKEFIDQHLLLEFKEEIAFKTAMGGENRILSDLKAFGVQNLKEYPDQINAMKEKKRIHFTRIEATVKDWRKLFDFLKSKGYKIETSWVPGITFGHYAMKIGGVVFEFLGNNKAETRNPYVKIYVVTKIENITSDEDAKIRKKAALASR
jgi:hypothetical protein